MVTAPACARLAAVLLPHAHRTSPVALADRLREGAIGCELWLASPVVSEGHQHSRGGHAYPKPHT